MTSTLSVDTAKRTRRTDGYVSKASPKNGKVIPVVTRNAQVKPSAPTAPTKGKLKTPPTSLVKTWLWMYREAKEYELRQIALKNLTTAFESVEDAANFVLEK